jgi:hypothetical protein
MDTEENAKILILVNVLVRAIMGMSEQTENVIFEILSDNYTHEKMKMFITNFDEQFINSIVAILAGNGSVCDALNCISGSEEEKRQFIINRIRGTYLLPY